MSQRRPHRPADTVRFDVPASDAKIIKLIALRARKDLGWDVLHTQMDITATHRNGNPLRLGDLLAADGFNFAHDLGGICRHLDRDTGKLMNHFRPRFSGPGSLRRRVA